MNNILKILQRKQIHVTKNVLSFLCIEGDTHILFYFIFATVSPFQHITIQKNYSIYMTLEKRMPIFSLFLPDGFLIFFSLFFFSVPKHSPN